MDAVYTEGDTVQLHMDLYPAYVHPVPPGVPDHGIRKRVVVTERCLTIGWAVAGVVQRVDIPMTTEQTSTVTLRGGKAGDYELGQDKGCGSCGSGAIKNWKPWPGVIMSQVPRRELAQAELRRNSGYGLPSRYSRS